MYEEKRDIHQYAQRLEVIRGNTDRDERLCLDDRKLILDFTDWCLRDNEMRRALSKGRVTKYVFTLRKICEKLNWKPLKEVTKEDLQVLVDSITSSDYTVWTVHDYKVLLKIFFRWMYPNAEDPKEYPSIVKWIRVSDEGATKGLDIGDILTEEEVLKMVGNAENDFQQCLIMTLYESGARIGELATAKVKDLRFEAKSAEKGSSEYAMLTLFGKTGRRDVPLYSSVPYLRRLLNSRECSSDSFIFDDKNKLFYSTVQKALRRVADKCGILKSVKPHAFRHARACDLSKRNWKETKLCQFFGWRIGSDMPGTYIKMTGVDLVADVLELNGHRSKVEEKVSILKPIKCMKCGMDNEATSMFCQCGYPLTPEAIERLETQRKGEMTQMVREQMVEIFNQNPQMFQTGSINAPYIQQQVGEGYLDSGSRYFVKDGYVVKK